MSPIFYQKTNFEIKIYINNYIFKYMVVYEFTIKEQY